MTRPTSQKQTTSMTSCASSSVFDRLYSKSTESSRIRKCVAPVTNKNILTRQDDEPRFPAMKKENGSNRMGKPASSTRGTKTSTFAPTVPSTGGIHDRLYSSGTASYNSKRKATNDSRGPLKTKTNS
jgi:hypothetical protein